MSISLNLLGRVETDEDAKERSWKLAMTLMRDWMPAGTALRRLGQAMQQGQTTEDQLRILFAAYT